MSVVPAEIADRLLAECLGRPRMPEKLRWLCDHVGGRISGAESGRLAEEWAAEAMREFGFTDVRFQDVPVKVWERGELAAYVATDPGWVLTAVAHGYCPAKSDMEAEVIDAGHGVAEDYGRLGDAARGKLALCDEGVPDGGRRLHRTEKLLLALEHGAAGLMMLSSAPGGLPRTGVCHRGGSPIPSLGISKEDGERLLRLLKDGMKPRVRLHMVNRLAETIARNVIGDVPGQGAGDEIVLAGGHLDSWDISQGATDNGLGCAIALEAVRAISSIGIAPRRTVRCVLYAAEETGLHGSRAYASAPRAADSHAAIMNFDMTGDPFGYWIPGRKEPPELLRGLVKQLAPVGMRDAFASGAGLHSDHQHFMLEGVPVVCLQGTLPDMGGGHYYHSVGDTFEKVSIPGMCRASACAAHTLWALATEPERSMARLSYDQVRAMVEEAKLTEALLAEGYAGPAVQVQTA